VPSLRGREQLCNRRCGYRGTSDCSDQHIDRDIVYGRSTWRDFDRPPGRKIRTPTDLRAPPATNGGTPVTAAMGGGQRGGGLHPQPNAIEQRTTNGGADRADHASGLGLNIRAYRRSGAST
jgi:hypothetical protein